MGHKVLHIGHNNGQWGSRPGETVQVNQHATISVSVKLAKGVNQGRTPICELLCFPQSLSQMLGLFAISFSYGFVFNSLNSIVIPKEIERMVVERQSMWLGLVMAVC